MLRRSLIGGSLLMLGDRCRSGPAHRSRPLAPLPPDGLSALLRSSTAGYERGRHHHLLVRVLQPQSRGSDRDSARPGQLHRAEGIRRPAADVVPAARATRRPQARRTGRRERERGVFTVTVPPGFKGDVVWTLRTAARRTACPDARRPAPISCGGRWRWDRIRRSCVQGGRPGRPRAEGNQTATRFRRQSGQPLTLTILVNDDSKREVDPTPVKERGPERPALSVGWFKHSGRPGGVQQGEGRPQEL